MTDKIDNETSQRLAVTRDRLRLTPKEMAQYLGVPATTYASWESGYRAPAASVVRLLDVLGTIEALAPDLHGQLMP